MNVLEDPAGFADLQKLGLRTVPVLARGDKFIFGQNTQQIPAIPNSPAIAMRPVMGVPNRTRAATMVTIGLVE